MARAGSGRGTTRDLDLPYPSPAADDNATIRVTNLSEDTRETDLQELFRPFGSISRIYLAKDKTTGQSKVGMEGFPPLGGGDKETPPPPRLRLTLSLSSHPRVLPSSASTAGRMQPELLPGSPDSAMTT